MPHFCLFCGTRTEYKKVGEAIQLEQGNLRKFRLECPNRECDGWFEITLHVEKASIIDQMIRGGVEV